MCGDESRRRGLANLGARVEILQLERQAQELLRAQCLPLDVGRAVQEESTDGCGGDDDRDRQCDERIGERFTVAGYPVPNRARRRWCWMCRQRPLLSRATLTAV
jgi:hypothetical protein